MAAGRSRRHRAWTGRGDELELEVGKQDEEGEEGDKDSGKGDDEGEGEGEGDDDKVTGHARPFADGARGERAPGSRNAAGICMSRRPRMQTADAEEEEEENAERRMRAGMKGLIDCRRKGCDAPGCAGERHKA